MPILISFTPSCPPLLINCSKAGIKDSPPSIPNLFVPINLTAKNFSNPSACINLFKIPFLPVSVKFILFSLFSIRSLNHVFSLGSEICINSIPIVEQ